MSIATPNEAGAIGVLRALGTAAIYKRLSRKVLTESLASTAKTSSMILIIVASAKLFSQMFAFTGGVTAITKWIVTLDFSKWMMLPTL